jgi:OPA family glycerol-3-phosphate transporter-like MFS transporter
MGLISLSFLFGDFLSRVFLGYLIGRGWGWQSIFYVSAAVLALILIPTVLFLRNAPGEVGLPEPPADPVSVFATKSAQEKKGLAGLILPLLTSRPFLVACVLSFGFTFMRETFNDWTPTFLHEVAKMSEGDAATASSLFPLFGGISVLGVGFLSDRWGKVGRALIIVVGLALSTLGLLALAMFHFHGNTTLYVALVALIAFVMIGPYSFLAGAVSLDFGGKKASATAAGWIDGVGYIGGILSGYLIAQVAENAGWQAAFVVLAVTAFLSFVFALLYWRMELANVLA